MVSAVTQVKFQINLEKGEMTLLLVDTAIENSGLLTTAFPCPVLVWDFGLRNERAKSMELLILCAN